MVVDPGVLNPYEFIGAVINRRLPNPFMPDAPQRIATDTSQKLAIRFGETIKAYEERGLDKSNLVLIPLVLAGYARYLKGIDDNGQPFEISPDPLLAELQAIVSPLQVKEGEQDFSCLKALYSRADVFGVDLYAVGLGEKIEGMVKELYAGNGAVRKTLHKYTLAALKCCNAISVPTLRFCFAAAWVFVLSKRSVNLLSFHGNRRSPAARLFPKETSAANAVSGYDPIPVKMKSRSVRRRSGISKKS